MEQKFRSISISNESKRQQKSFSLPIFSIFVSWAFQSQLVIFLSNISPEIYAKNLTSLRLDQLIDLYPDYLEAFSHRILLITKHFEIKTTNKTIHANLIFILEQIKSIEEKTVKLAQKIGHYFQTLADLDDFFRFLSNYSKN
jgi:hypothetical protein